MSVDRYLIFVMLVVYEKVFVKGMFVYAGKSRSLCNFNAKRIKACYQTINGNSRVQMDNQHMTIS